MKEIEVRSPREMFLHDMEQILEDNLPEEWEKKDKDLVKQGLTNNSVKTGVFSAIPMLCKSTCPFIETCEYARKGIAPFQLSRQGKTKGRCVYEVSMVTSFMADYIEQLDVDVSNWVEMSQIRDLVDQEIQMVRKSKYLAKEDFIQENVVGIDNDGDPIFKKELHQAVELEDKLHKRRTQLFKQILATRESKVKANALQMDSAQNMANLISNMRNIERTEQAQLKKKLGIIDVDEYILEDQKELSEEPKE